ncbi:hypothetical protein OUZ56_032439 [Daphnia magna]|uniref:NEK6-subfamily protein kinase n=1 Tax=Daphnia magna TaxID=35525 RepID=A0ABR0B8X2_9CRUS|nr:hypothetical protein OUZ56_032439 [Daphnia magna]
MAAVGTLLAAGVPYRIGDVVDGKYRIDGLLGRGGMGLAAAATHVALDQPLAIKFLKQELVGDDATRARFAREARACVRIRSEHVCRVLDVGEMADGVPYMVMERLEGLDLSQVLKAEGPFEISRAVDCVLQACEGLYEAHRLGIVHRDLKPGNLFLSHSATGQPLVKVLDFGIARTVDAQEGETLTATGSILGSPHYMSPEQIVSPKTVDERSDIWSLAIILYRLLANALPFEADSFGRLAILIAGDQPLSLVARRPDVPPALEQVLFRALDKDPNARYANVGVLLLHWRPTARFARWQRRLHRRIPSSPGARRSRRTCRLRSPGPGRGSRQLRPMRCRSPAAPRRGRRPKAPNAGPFGKRPTTRHGAGDASDSDSAPRRNKGAGTGPFFASAQSARPGTQTMKNSVRLAVIAFFASSLAFSSVAFADGKSLSQTLTGPAKTEFEAGIALYESGDYGASVIKFRAAYEQSKDNRLLWNIANCERLLHHYVKARKLVREYVANGGSTISADDKNSAKQFLEITESAVSDVKFEIAEPGVEVIVDGDVVGTTPLASAQIDVGKHVVSLKKQGFATQEIPLVGVGGAAATVKAEMVRAVGHLSVSAGASDDIEIDGKFAARGTFDGDLPKGNTTSASPRQGRALTTDTLTSAQANTARSQSHSAAAAARSRSGHGSRAARPLEPGPSSAATTCSSRASTTAQAPSPTATQPSASGQQRSPRGVAGNGGRSEGVALNVEDFRGSAS